MAVALDRLPDDPLLVVHGDCIAEMASMPEASVDAIVTDPPYGIGFMGREWDTFAPARLAELAHRRQRKGTQHTSERWPTKVSKTSQGGGPSVEYDFSNSGAHRFQAWSEAWAREALRVLRPGGYLLSFCGTRMQHRMTSGIEDAGFKIRDCLMWIYGSGFPKSLDVRKAFDKRAGVEGEVLRVRDVGPDICGNAYENAKGRMIATERAPSSALARKWYGWGTALKPAWEPIILAQKPLDGTYIANLEKHGVGALNIDGSRISYASDSDRESAFPGGETTSNGAGTLAGPRAAQDADTRRSSFSAERPSGRWPANVLLDEEAARMMDAQSGERPSGKMHAFHRNGPQRKVYGHDALAGYQVSETYGDTGGASRFFYVAKASRADRGTDNTHPTVKPVELMRYLVRLVTPPGGLVLDPFAGSGTTGQAALSEGMRCVLIEKEAEYVEGIRRWRGALQVGHGL